MSEYFCPLQAGVLAKCGVFFDHQNVMMVIIIQTALRSDKVKNNIKQ